MRVRADYLECDAWSLGCMGIQGLESQANARKAKVALLRRKAQEEKVLSKIENTKVRGRRPLEDDLRRAQELSLRGPILAERQ
jgi:hypothetical protein